MQCIGSDHAINGKKVAYNGLSAWQSFSGACSLMSYAVIVWPPVTSNDKT
jgi:hypothetical protein